MVILQMRNNKVNKVISETRWVENLKEKMMKTGNFQVKQTFEKSLLTVYLVDVIKN